MSIKPFIPQHNDDFTPEWVTSALRDCGALEQARVKEVSSERIGVGKGFIGSLTRLRLRYDQPEGGAPSSIIAKLPGQEFRAAYSDTAAGFGPETRFFEELASDVPIRVPLCYCAAMDPDPIAGWEPLVQRILAAIPPWIMRWLLPALIRAEGSSKRRFLLLIEDLEDEEIGDQVAGCGAERAEQALRNLAMLHAAYWKDPSLERHTWMPNSMAFRAILQMMFKRSWRACLERYGSTIDTPFNREFMIWGEKNGLAILNRIAELPVTLLHGDYRLDNLFFHETDGKPSITTIDWQQVSKGPAIIDLAYFVTGSVRSEVAAKHELDLIHSYYDELTANGVRDYSFDQLLEGYALSKIFSALALTAASVEVAPGNARGEQLFSAWIQRVMARVPDDYARFTIP